MPRKIIIVNKKVRLNIIKIWNHLTMSNENNTPPNIKFNITVNYYELNKLNKIPINLNNSKDRSKLKYILKYERHKLKQRDIDRLKQILAKTKH